MIGDNQRSENMVEHLPCAGWVLGTMDQPEESFRNPPLRIPRGKVEEKGYVARLGMTISRCSRAKPLKTFWKLWWKAKIRVAFVAQ